MYLKEFDAIRNVDLNVCHVPSFKAFKKLDIYAHTWGERMLGNRGKER